jgi:hypothetical protein
VPKGRLGEAGGPEEVGLVRHRDDIPVIGWREWLAIPSLNVPRIKAKIDSGARTSAIHAFGVRTFSERGAPHVSFEVHPEQRRRRGAVACVAEILDERYVTSSSGHKQRRFVIRADVSLGGLTWPIELTLASRDRMGFRMLLGREAIQNRFLVDVGRSFIAGFSHADISTVFVRK